MASLAELSIPLPELPVAHTPENGRTSKRSRGHFLRGPIPLEWLQRAANLSGRALHVGIALWYLDGFEQTHTVEAKPNVFRQFGVDRHAKYRALKSLETDGLISVRRQRGKAPKVIIREFLQLREAP